MISTNRDLPSELIDKKYVLVRANEFTISPDLTADFDVFLQDWDHLELDQYLPGGASFRTRRFNHFYFLFGFFHKPDLQRPQGIIN